MNQEMTTEEARDALGKANYDAYCGDRGWKSFHGEPLPLWQDVKLDIKRGWIKGAQAVCQTHKKITVCVYCRQHFNIETEDGKKALVDHITTCDKSPLVQAVNKIQERWERLINAINTAIDETAEDFRGELK